ncbi:hypothetical protein ACLKA7_007698 [Drosophila subpalustris]
MRLDDHQLSADHTLRKEENWNAVGRMAAAIMKDVEEPSRQLSLSLQGGSQKAEQPKAKDEFEWQLAPYIPFFPELSSQRRGINPSTSQANFGELNFDDSSCSLSSTMEFVPIQLEADASTLFEAASYSYATPNMRRKVEKAKPKSEEDINMLENVMAKQEEILKSSDPAPIRTIVRYSDEALRDMDPEQAKETEQA